MPTPFERRFAVIIEPSPSLADTVKDSLLRRDFDVVVATTHAGAARQVLERARVDFLVAAVPAPGEDHAGAYLEEARARNPDMAVVVMLSDPAEAMDDAPPAATTIVKPFSVAQLETTLQHAWAVALRNRHS